MPTSKQDPDFIPAEESPDFISAGGGGSSAIAPPPVPRPFVPGLDPGSNHPVAYNPDTGRTMIDHTTGKPRTPEAYEASKNLIQGRLMTPENLANVAAPGVGTAASGVGDVAHGKFLQGGAKVLAGTSEAAAPAIGIGALERPVGTAIGMAAGQVAAPAAKHIVGALGGSPEAQHFAEEAGGYIPAIVGSLAKKTVAPETPEMSARRLAKTINPPVQEWNNFIGANASEAGNIKAFAEKNSLPLKTQLDWAKAAKGAAEEARQFYKEKVLEPNSRNTVQVGTEYKSLGEINSRIEHINNLLRDAYQKREAGQTMSALANEPELKAEKASLTKLLEGELAKATGTTPEQISGLRQRYGKMYSIADATTSAVNQRESSSGKAIEGRRDVPQSIPSAITDQINKLLGGPEGIANRNFRKTIGKSAFPVTDYPKISASTDSAPAPITPKWLSAGVESGRPNPTFDISYPDAGMKDKLAPRRVDQAFRRADQKSAERLDEQRKVENRAKHGIIGKT